MKIFPTFTTSFLVLLLGLTTAAAQTLRGRTGSSAEWGSGWLILHAIADFNKGDTLLLTVGGSAKHMLVRLLSRGFDPNSPSGIDGGSRDIPKNRVVRVVLESDHSQVWQISVHGGSSPWNIVSLGEDNGPATIVNIVRKSYQTQRRE